MISGQAIRKIVAHTLTTKREITMITDIRVVSAPDLSVDNEVLNLSSIPLPEGKTLAGVCWFVVDYSVYEALLSVFRFIYGLICKKFPDYRVWLLVGNSAWQPDTRIIRYRKLWNALAVRGVKVSHSWNAQEVMHEKEGKLKFFGATQLSKLSVESVVKALLEERCSYIIVLPKAVGPESIIDIGWSGNLADDLDFIDALTRSGGLLIKRFGEFDDEERGMISVGRPALVNSLAN